MRFIVRDINLKEHITPYLYNVMLSSYNVIEQQSQMVSHNGFNKGFAYYYTFRSPNSWTKYA